MTVTLTDRMIQGLAPGKILFDALVPGFAVRAYPSGKKAFLFDATINGKPKRTVIGSYPAWSLKAARDKAASHRVVLDNGHDPFAEKAKATTLNGAWQRYQESYLQKLVPAAAKDIRSMWACYILPQLGAKPLEAITFSDIEKLHHSIAKPYRANRVYESLRRVLNLCVKWELLEANPAKGVEINRETPRQTYLTDTQVKSLLAHLPDTESGDVIRILFLTGARIGEVLSMGWDHLDLEQGIWTKPASTTKQKRVHRVTLSKSASTIIKGRARVGELVFCRADGRPIRDIRKTWSWCFKRAGIPPVRIHDARHTVASLLASDGSTLHLIGKVLGHSNPNVTNRYAHLYDDPVREALDRASQRVSEVSKL